MLKIRLLKSVMSGMCSFFPITFLNYLPLLPSQEFLHLVFGKVFDGAAAVVYTSRHQPGMCQGFFTWHPAPVREFNAVLWICVDTFVWYVCTESISIWMHLTSLLSRELMKSFARSVISSKLSSSNSHCTAVTRARVSESLSPWNGDSPLNLQEKIRFR